jgi:hypothetical protein
MRKYLATISMLLAIAMYTYGCGSSILGAIAVPTVSASGFTNASLSGGYGLPLAMAPNGTAVAQLTFDGVGLVSGAYTEVLPSGALCQGTVSGNYSVGANGIGTVTLGFNVQTSGCPSSGQLDLAIVLAANGEYFSYASFNVNGQAIKQ